MLLNFHEDDSSEDELGGYSSSGSDSSLGIGVSTSRRELTREEKGKGKARATPSFSTPKKLAGSRNKPAQRFARDPSPSITSGSDSDNDNTSNRKDRRAVTEKPYSDSDSEEDAYPVGESSGSKSPSRRHLSEYSHYEDPLDAYYEREQQKARQRAQIAHNRDLAALRTIRLNAFTRSSAMVTQTIDHDLSLITSILQDISLRRQREEELIDKEFKERNEVRWKEINGAIERLEKVQKDVALDEARKKREQAEEEAKKLREAEQERIRQEEEAAKEKKRKEEEEQKIKAEQEEKQRKEKEEKQRKEKEEAEKAAVGTQAGASAAVQPATRVANPLQDLKREFEKWHAKVNEIKTTVLPAVSSNPTWRNACRSLKRTLSTRISNISASSSDINAKTREIYQLLIDSKASTRETYLWSLNLLSKRIIGMASSNTESDQSGVTYALAQVVIALLLSGNLDELAEVLMARFVKRCPYVLPYYPSKGQMSSEDFNKLIGRKSDTEPSISFNQRMSGIVSLYAAVVQTSPTAVPQLVPGSSNMQNIPSYFRPEAGWRWMALLLRPPLPLLDLTPLLLHTFLRMSGERLRTLYGKQYIKLITAIAEQGIDEGKVSWNKHVMGDLSKVRLMIGDWLQNGRVVGAEGRIPPP